MDPDVPLVVPEVNAHAALRASQGDHQQPELHDTVDDRGDGCTAREYGLEELVVASYQAASGAGQEGIDTLRDQYAKVAASPDAGYSGR